MSKPTAFEIKWLGRELAEHIHAPKIIRDEDFPSTGPKIGKPIMLKKPPKFEG